MKIVIIWLGRLGDLIVSSKFINSMKKNYSLKCKEIMAMREKYKKLADFIINNDFLIDFPHIEDTVAILKVIYLLITNNTSILRISELTQTLAISLNTKYSYKVWLSESYFHFRINSGNLKNCHGISVNEVFRVIDILALS